MPRLKMAFRLARLSVDPIQTDDRMFRARPPLRDASLEAMLLQQWDSFRFPGAAIRGNHIAWVIAEGHHFIAFEVFMPAESGGYRHQSSATVVVPSPWMTLMSRYCLVKLPHRALENGLKALGFEASKGAIPRVVDLPVVHPGSRSAVFH